MCHLITSSKYWPKILTLNPTLRSIRYRPKNKHSLVRCHFIGKMSLHWYDITFRPPALRLRVVQPLHPARTECRRPFWPHSRRPCTTPCCSSSTCSWVIPSSRLPPSGGTNTIKLFGQNWWRSCKLCPDFGCMNWRPFLPNLRYVKSIPRSFIHT